MQEKKKLHKLLSILLCFMLVAGMMPAMSLTAFATTTINTVKASGIKAPVAGESATDSSYKTVTLPSGQGYKLNEVVWYNSDYYDAVEATTFEAGKKYYAEIRVDAEAGYQFASTSAINVSYEEELPYFKEVVTGNAKMFFAVEFTCPTNIDPVTVTELTITYDTDACKIDTSKTEDQVSAAIKNNSSLAQDGTITNPGKFSASLVYWNASQWQAAGTDQISSSRQYAFSFEVPLKDRYSWPEEIFTNGDMSRVKITINGEVYKPAANMINYIPSSDRYVAIRYVPAEQKSNISKISATMAKPTLYKSPSYEVTATGEGYKVSVENWYSAPTFPELTGGTVMTSTDKFREGTRYMAELKFTADEGYNFVDGISVGVTNSSGWRIDTQDSKSIVVFVNMGYAQHEHNYQNVITKATTSANGYIGKECAICGDKITETIYYPKTIKLSYTSTTYNGKVKSPTVSVVDAAGNKLVEGTDYDVTVPTGRVNAEKYTYKVVFKGNYSGSKTLNLTINQASYTPTVKGYSGTYDGKKHTISFSGLKSGSTIKYRTSPTGKWTTTKPTRTSVGKTTVYYQITNKNYKTVKGSKTIVINPVKTSITSLSKGTKSFTVKWAKKTTQTTGYQIQYSTSSTFASGNKTVTVTSNKTTSKTIKSLKAKKKYYVRVRTYKTVNGVKYYSGWSAKKYVTTK